ncbi:cytochrome P450 2J2-like [Lissotriton helveticus]
MDPCIAITNSVTNVIALVIFGHRYSSDDKEFLQLTKINTFLVGFLFSMRARLYNAFPWMMHHLPGPHQDFLNYYTFLNNFVNKEIQIHKENLAHEEPQDFIDYYLIHMSTVTDDANSTYDEANMNHAVIEIFIGATVPVSSTLRTALLHMAVQPAIQEKVQKEMDTVLGESHVIHYEDRERLPYTNAVVHEILRYGNGGILFRQAMKQTSLKGFTFEKGTYISCNLYSLLNDPDYWETPDQFNPGHFLDIDGKFVRKEAFMPFAAGPRGCIGELLAMTEIFIFFTSLLRTFNFRLPEGAKNVVIERGTLLPQPYEICAVPR